MHRSVKLCKALEMSSGPKSMHPHETQRDTQTSITLTQRTEERYGKWLLIVSGTCGNQHQRPGLGCIVVLRSST
eukprot:754329-Amphidinium_carterae.2